MTNDAKKHLDKAAGLLARGDGFYAQAADEIIAAQKSDPTLSNREIGNRFDRGEAWVRRLVTWRTTASSSTHPTPYAGEADAVNLRKTKQMLREAPPEQIAELLSSPRIRRNVAEAQQIASLKHPIEDSRWRRDWKLPHISPSFISLVVRINSALIELETAVGSWENPTQIPSEFSSASFDDIAEKAMRIKDHVNALRSADNDDFQDIVRNFRVVSSGS